MISVTLSIAYSLYYRGQFMGDCRVFALKQTEEIIF